MTVRVKFWLYRRYPTKIKTFCDIIISRVVLLIDGMIIMDLLERINNCSDDELTSIIDAALQSAINNSDRKERLGFTDGGAATAKIPSHKGFIPPDSRIKYSNLSMNMYSMKTTDYIYEFANYVKRNKISNKGTLVKYIENFINGYFGISNGTDMRDAYFDQIAFQTTTTDDEYFEKLENLEIGDLKGKNIAMCTERAAIAQNLLSLFGFDTYYCMGCVSNNGREESHCFNIARAKDTFMLLDYSLPVPVFENGRAIDYAPFQGSIGLDELEDVLVNGLNKDFPSYEYIRTPQGIKRVATGELRTYNVGSMTFEQTQSKSR